jgi:signal transduction histidine kinase
MMPGTMAVMGSETAALRRLLDVALALGAERRTEAVLRVILDAARDLAHARYAALGVPDGDGGFSLFLTAGVDSATWARIGALPRTHGLLGALLDDATAIRLTDIRADRRFVGWPSAHPDLRSFLGVPIVAGGEVVAELFLADRADGGNFTEADQQLIETLAAHAALAVVNAQRNERARELSVAEERTRLARDLHDSVTQTLFSVSLAAESAVAMAGPAAEPRLTEQLVRLRELAASALAEMRSLVETLRPADLDADGLAGALRKRIELLRRVHRVPLTLNVHGPAGIRDHTVEREVFRVATEALSNALQHAEARRITITLDTSGGAVHLTVADDGKGFDLATIRLTSRRLGLTSMRERAEALGGVLHVDTAPGAGTRLTLEVPAAC